MNRRFFNNSGLKKGLETLIRREDEQRVVVEAKMPEQCKSRQLAAEVYAWEGQRVFVQDTPTSPVRTFYCTRVEPGSLLVWEKGQQFVLTRSPRMVIRNRVQKDVDALAGKARHLSRMAESSYKATLAEVEALEAHMEAQTKARVQELLEKLERQREFWQEGLRETHRQLSRLGVKS